MSQLQFYRVSIARDPNVLIVKEVLSWEVPILQEMYGEGSVEIGEEVTRDADGVPTESAEEMARLSRTYGQDQETKVPFVEIVYGRGPAGVKALQRSMDAARVDDEPKVRRGRPPKVAEEVVAE